MIRRVLGRIIPKTMSEKTSSIITWSAGALALRVLLTPLLGSRDLSALSWVSFSLLNSHQLVQSNDPPLVFLMFAGLLALFGPVIPSSIGSFYLSSTNFSPSELKLVLALTQQGVQQLLVVLKLPYFLFDFATGLLLLRMVEDAKKAFLAYKLWLFNPVSIFVTYAVGQYDIIVAFIIVLAFLQLQRNRFHYSAFALGFAGAIKLIGLLLLLPLAIYRSKNETGKTGLAKLTKTLAVGLVPFILGLLPLLVIPSFYESANLALSSVAQNGFYGTTLLNRGLAGLSLFSGLETFVFTYSLSIRTGVPFDIFFLQPIMYLVLLLSLFHFGKWSFGGLQDAIVIFLLSYYALDTFHPQWFLWVQPLLIVALVNNYEKLAKAYWTISALFFTYILNFGPYLTYGLLVPVFSNALAGASSYSQLGQPFDIFTLSSRMIFSFILLYTALLLFLERWGGFLPWRRSAVLVSNP